MIRTTPPFSRLSSLVSRLLFSSLGFFLPWQTQKIVRPGLLNGQSWEYGIVGVYLSDIVIVVTVVVTLATIFAQRRMKNILHSAPCSLLPASFLLWLFVSSLWALDPLVSVIHALWIVEAFVLAWIVMVNQEHRSLLVWSFIVGMVFQAVVGIAQALTQSTMANPWLGWTLYDAAAGGSSVVEAGEFRYLRAYGGFGHPNVFGGYLAVALILFLTLMPATLQKIRARWQEAPGALGSIARLVGLWSAYVLLLAALFFTFSRSAWITFVTGSAVLVAGWLKSTKTDDERRERRWFFWRVGMVTVIVVAALGFSWQEPLRARLGVGSERLEQKSVEDRLGSFKEALLLIERSPWLGTGLGNATNTFAAGDPQPTIVTAFMNQQAPKPVWMYQPVHNVFLLIVVEIGLIGSVLLMFAVAQRLKGRKRFNHDPIPYSLFPILFILAFFDHYLWSLHAGILLVGFAVGTMRADR